MLIRARASSLYHLACFLLGYAGSVSTDREAQFLRLLRHAAGKVPYYRERFRAQGLNVMEIRGFEDLHRIPLTAKTDLREVDLRDRLAEGFERERLFHRATSGSSGEPLTVCCSWFEESLLSCFRAGGWRSLGIGPGDRLVRLKIQLSGRRGPAWLLALQRLGLYQEVGLDCLQPPDRILERLRELDPTVILSFPGILADVALQNKGQPLPSLKKILVGGETLSPLVRRQLEEEFGVPVFSNYGSHEFNQIALECSRSGLYHVVNRSVILEILRDGVPVKPGEPGEVVATALHSFAMPFIRYRLGDLVVRGPDTCPCGRRGLTIKSIQGRETDSIVLPDGERVHPFAVIAELSHDFDWIRQYRLTQELDGRVRVELVLASHPPPAALDELGSRIRSSLRNRLEVQLEEVDEIRPNALGKFRICRSRLAQRMADSPVAAVDRER